MAEEVYVNGLVGKIGRTEEDLLKKLALEVKRKIEEERKKYKDKKGTIQLDKFITGITFKLDVKPPDFEKEDTIYAHITFESKLKEVEDHLRELPEKHPVLRAPAAFVRRFVEGLGKYFAGTSELMVAKSLFYNNEVEDQKVRKLMSNWYSKWAEGIKRFAEEFKPAEVKELLG